MRSRCGWTTCGTKLFAQETITYTNNAPQALDTIWMHLWPNAYRDRNSALCQQLDAHNDLSLHFATEDERGSIDSLDFTSNGSKLAWGFHPQHADIVWIKLERPLSTGSSIAIHTPFHVKLPSARISRLGHDGQAYYITQWFPKPAVFDNKGWHAMPYLTQGEFYSEFGSYDVSITLPANYVVGATGELQDASERAWMDSLAQRPPSFVLGNGRDPFPSSSEARKTLRFTQSDVHDFAWFADKRFQVRKGEVKLERSGRTVTTWVLVTPHNAAVWHEAITYVNESVRLYSQWVGDYAYASCTAIDGGTAAGGGMEYPMITIINDTREAFDLDVVIAHEVGHNWFYGMLGSNEREHPWMDEGVNSFFEQRYIEARYPGRRERSFEGLPISLFKPEGIPYREHNELLYRLNARRNWDDPIEGPATAFSELDYGTTVYAKTALVFDHLFHALGASTFDRCMQRYFQEWRFAHPYPADLRRVFEETSGQDLTWCFDELINTANKVDPRALRLKNGRFTYRSDAATELMFPVTAWHGADTLGTWWVNSAPGRNMVEVPFAGADRVRIDAMDRTLDIGRRNNEVRAYGLLKRTRLPQVKFFGGLEREDRRSIYWTPAIGYNAHDGWMAGVALHNTTFPSQRFEWAAAPMYGLASNRLAGGARFQWNHDRLRSNAFRNLHVGLSGFAASLSDIGGVERWYQRLVPSLQLDLRTPATAPEVVLRYRSILLWQYAEGEASTMRGPVAVDAIGQDVFHELSATTTRTKGLYPFIISLTALDHSAFTRLALDAKWSALYDRHKHRLTLRTFAGSFLRKNDALMRPEMGWRMHWGSSDLLYDHLFFDRQDVGRNTAQQFMKDQGGFKTPTAAGTSDTWIAAMNMELDLPFLLPLSVFANYGAAPYTRITSEGRTRDWKGYWEAGIGLRLWRDMIEAWVPLAMSKDITNELDLRGIDFTERIRFVFALEKMDPTQALRKLPH
ncbi:MAG: M1 family metallopeptidase [Flavobacteriales bacterium]